MSKIKEYNPPEVNIFVGYEGDQVPEGYHACLVGANIKFNLEALASYFFRDKSELSYDAFVVAAAVEYADYFKKRPEMGWGRSFSLDLPVSNPKVWNASDVNKSLVSALNMLTGDSWHINFRQRIVEIDWPKQITLNLPTGVQAVIAFSDGMDSRAVGGLCKTQLGEQLVKLRLSRSCSGKVAPFVAVPFDTHLPGNRSKNAERSGRSRGFKFAVLSIVASFLANSSRIIVPESGQGAIGPALVKVSRIPPDYRNHPAFFEAMERFAQHLLRKSVSFEIPRLWHTKGQTLREYVEETGDKVKWKHTISCWRDSRYASVNNKKRQCGICAACLLRRMSVHAAGLSEEKDQYLWHDLSSSRFEEGSAISFGELKGPASHRRYARAAVRHLHDLAYLDDPIELNINAGKIARAYEMKKAEVMSSQMQLIRQHRLEWENFLEFLGPKSFVAKWAVGGDSHAA